MAGLFVEEGELRRENAAGYIARAGTECAVVADIAHQVIIPVVLQLQRSGPGAEGALALVRVVSGNRQGQPERGNRDQQFGGVVAPFTGPAQARGQRGVIEQLQDVVAEDTPVLGTNINVDIQQL